MFDKEIDEIKQKSQIDSTIELVWRMEQLDFSSDICEVSLSKFTKVPFFEPDNNSYELPHYNLPQPGHYPNQNVYGIRPSRPSLSNPSFSQPNYQYYPYPSTNIPESSTDNPEMENLLGIFFNLKESKSFVPTVDSGFPPELLKAAKQLVKNSKQEYKIIRIYEIIILNLEKEKEIEDIMTGLYNLAKYPICLFMDEDRPEFHQIRTFSGYYTYEIKGKLAGFESILETVGYRFEGQLYKLDQDKKNDRNFSDNLARISCELLLAYEELFLFNEIRKITPNTIPLQHFRSQTLSKHALYNQAGVSGSQSQ